MSFLSSLNSIGHDVKKVWNDEVNIVKKSASQAWNDTVGLSTAAGAAYGYKQAVKSGATKLEAAQETGKNSIQGLGLGLAISFTGHMIDNQLKYTHQYW